MDFGLVRSDASWLRSETEHRYGTKVTAPDFFNISKLMSQSNLLDSLTFSLIYVIVYLNTQNHNIC